MIALLGQQSTSAQQLTSGADFLKIDSGARAGGMGGAFTAIADDVNAITYNPAGLALLTSPQVGYLHMLYLSDIGYNFGGAAFPLPDGENTWALGAGIINLGTPTFDSTLGLQPSVSAGDNAFLLSLAYRVKNVISFGLTGKYIMRTIAGYNAAAFGGDVGILYTPSDRFGIGLGLFNVGQSVQFISSADPLPMTARLGLAWKILDVPHNSLILSMDNGYQFGSGTYIGAVGTEYWFDKTLALRAGFTGDAYQQHWTGGVGVNVDPVEFDYAYAPMGTLGNTHRISLIVRFGGGEGEGLLAPTGFSAKAMDGSVSLHWKPVTSSSVVGYNIYVKKPNAPSLILVTKTHLGAKETSVKLNKLVNGQSYTFGVSSVSEGGRESGLITLAAIPVGETVLPAAQLLAPTGFKAAIDQVGVDLTWDQAPVSTVVGYNLYMADDLGKPGKKLNALLLTHNLVTLKKVNPDKIYKFLLTAVDKGGIESVSAPLAVNYAELNKSTVVAILPPAHFDMKVNEGRVALSWDDAGAGLKYNVYVSHDGTAFKLLTTDGPITKNLASLGPLHDGVSYYFGITTVTADGKESDKAVKALPTPVATPSK